MMLLEPGDHERSFSAACSGEATGIADGSGRWLRSAAMVFVLFGVVQLMANQFGFDRDGFRVYVLSAARRRDILMGKNLSFAPACSGNGCDLLDQLAGDLSHALGSIPGHDSAVSLDVSSVLLLINLLSIYAPVYVAAGSLKPSNPKLVTVLLHLVTFMILISAHPGSDTDSAGHRSRAEVSGLGPGRADMPAAVAGGMRGGRCAFTTSRSTGLGSLLQAREQKILETVTKKAT